VPELFEHPEGTSTGELEVDRILTAPNAITTLRLLCVPLFLYLLFGLEARGWAGFLLGTLGATDWIDGYLARRWNATTRWGAILDPIADKILVTGAVLGVLTSGSVQQIIIPCGLILFREFAVSALRETMAGRINLPVTLAAKWKTTLQMVALGCQLFARNWDGWGLPFDYLPAFQLFSDALIWLAALVTLWTGWQYFKDARRQLG